MRRRTMAATLSSQRERVTRASRLGRPRQRVVGGLAFPKYHRTPSFLAEAEFGYDERGWPLTYEAWLIRQQAPPPG